MTANDNQRQCVMRVSPLARQGSGWLKSGGTYVAYSSERGDLTIVIEKMDASKVSKVGPEVEPTSAVYSWTPTGMHWPTRIVWADLTPFSVKSACQRGGRSGGQIKVTQAENATFALDTAAAAALRGSSLAVWHSNFGLEATGTDQLFMRAPDAHVVDGAVTLEVLPNWAYTITTIWTGGKGVTAPPASEKFPHSYTDNFDACPLGGIPKMVAPMAGAFDCVNAGGARAGRSVRQVRLRRLVHDCTGIHR
jgi:hypothetical protein